MFDCNLKFWWWWWTRNLATANRSRVSCTHNTSTASAYSNSVTLKSRLGVIEGRWKRHHSIDHIRLVISPVIWRWILCQPWNVGRGHSSSLKMIPFESLSAVSCSPSIVTMAVSLAISDIFIVKEWPDFKILVWGRSRSLKMAPFDRPCTTFYWSANRHYIHLYSP